MSDEETPRESGRGTGGAGKRRADRAAKPAIPQDVVQRFADAYWHYVTALQQMTVDEDVQQRISEAHRDYAVATQTTQPLADEARDRVMRAYGAMMSAPATEAAEPQRELTKALETAAEEASGRMREAHQAYAAASQEVPTSLEQRADEAFARYVEETARAWSEAEPAALAPEVLLAIGQGLAAAAAMRAASLQVIEQTKLAAAAMGAVGA